MNLKVKNKKIKKNPRGRGWWPKKPRRAQQIFLEQNITQPSGNESISDEKCQQRNKKTSLSLKPGRTFTLGALKRLRYHTCPHTVTKRDLMKTFFILLNRKRSSILNFQKRVYWTQRTNGKLKLIGSENSCSAQAVLKAWNKYSSNKVTVRGTLKRGT